MDLLFPSAPEGLDFSGLSDDELDAFIADSESIATDAGADPASYVTEERTAPQLLQEMRDGVAALTAARQERESRQAEDVSNEQLAAEMAELAAAAAVEPDPEPEPEDESDEPEEAVTAASEPVAEPTPAAPLPRPARARRSAPAPERALVPLTASAPNLGFDVGEPLPDAMALARLMENRHAAFGAVADGTWEKVPVAKASWAGMYPDDRRLDHNMGANWRKIEDVVDPDAILRNFVDRRDRALQEADGALVASGGLCAPVTPYYQLAMISQANRPIRDALARFNADRGGIRFARPAALSAITTGVGINSAADDLAGGTFAAKSCQVVACPAFSEVDVDIIFHCIQLGNLGARTFPERTAQWNSLVLAGHARTAETNLLDKIGAASTAVTAANTMGLGASAQLYSQILTARDGMISRHRMDPDTVLRILLPFWAADLIVSDVMRGQFGRWEVNRARATALLREINVEPTFYLDGQTGASQVYGAQSAGALLTFPSTVVWYLFPEGSFLYLDGGTLELGLVRDSVLNATNDFQIFGESFESVAFVGVESLKVTTTVCDHGTVTLPNEVLSCAY